MNNILSGFANWYLHRGCGAGLGWMAGVAFQKALCEDEVFWAFS